MVEVVPAAGRSRVTELVVSVVEILRYSLAPCEMVKAEAVLSMISKSVAWVARETVASLISTMLSAESKTIVPLVVVLIVRLAEVELMLLVPAPPSSIDSPVPALVMTRTSPVAEL